MSWLEHDEDRLVQRISEYTYEQPLDKKGLRASKLFSVCPREFFFQYFAPPRSTPVDMASLLRMERGTWCHAFLQNKVLGPLNILLGDWVCRCGHVAGGPMPSECKCGDPRFTYREMAIWDDDLRVSGHLDGEIVTGEYGPLVLEIKTTNAWSFQKLELWEGYKWQANIYMHNRGRRATLFLFVNADSLEKNKLEIAPLIYAYDEGIYEQARAKALGIWAALEKGDVPEGTCADMTCKTAKSCPFKRECMKEITRGRS